MAAQINVPFRNALLGALNTAFASGRLRIYSGSQPATANLAPTGTLLVDITLPATPFASASGGSALKDGTWQDLLADASGDAGWFRISASGDDLSENGNYARLDGTVTATGGGGDMTLASVALLANQAVTITGCTVTMPAAA